MLKITILVDSGIKEIVQLKSSLKSFSTKHNPENVHIFHKGLILRLMGESFSQYNISRLDSVVNWKHKKLILTGLPQELRDSLNNDIVNEFKVVEEFLAKLETKHIINPYRENYDLMRFEQFKKSGALFYPSYLPISKSRVGLVERTEETPMFNDYYKDAIENGGLLDIALVPVNNMTLICKNSAEETVILAMNILNNAFGDLDTLSLAKATETAEQLKHLFITDISQYKTLNFGSVFHHFMKDFKTNAEYVKAIKAARKNKDDEKIQHLEESSRDHYLRHQCKLFYYAYKYLECEERRINFKEGTAKAGSFDTPDLFNYTLKKAVKPLLTWCGDLDKPLCTPASSTAYGSFRTSMLDRCRNGVSSSNVVTNIKYDGTFELFIKTDSETEQLILDRMEFAKVWRLRVGKQCLGSLVSVEQAPNIFFDKLDEYEND